IRTEASFVFVMFKRRELRMVRRGYRTTGVDYAWLKGLTGRRSRVCKNLKLTIKEDPHEAVAWTSAIRSLPRYGATSFEQKVGKVPKGNVQRRIVTQHQSFTRWINNGQVDHLGRVIGKLGIIF